MHTKQLLFSSEQSHTVFLASFPIVSSNVKMIGEMAIAIPLSGFNNFRRLVSPILLLKDHFLYLVSTFSEKMKNNNKSEVCVFFSEKCTIELLLALLLSVWRVQMPLERSNVGNIGITLDPLLQKCD